MTLGVLCAAGVLGGCSTMESINPINWWHDMQGGKIAEQRPAPPGASEPYPNLGSVPVKPEPPDREAMKKLTDALVADRTNAQYTNQAAPLADPSSPSASPGLFGVGSLSPPPPAPPPGTASASASMQAANAPPAPRTPPIVAPEPPAPPASAAAVASGAAAPGAAATASGVSGSGTTAPGTSASGATGSGTSGLVALAPVPQAAPVAPPAAISGTTSPGAAPSTSSQGPVSPARPLVRTESPAMPPLPAQEPARAAVAPIPVPSPAPVAPPAGIPVDASATALAFNPGSATLPPGTIDAVKKFAATRGGGLVAVTGYGDAPTSDPFTQSGALTLGLARAQTVADALAAAGVPRTDIRVGADAGGRGASLRLLQ